MGGSGSGGQWEGVCAGLRRTDRRGSASREERGHWSHPRLGHGRLPRRHTEQNLVFSHGEIHPFPEPRCPSSSPPPPRARPCPPTPGCVPLPLPLLPLTPHLGMAQLEGSRGLCAHGSCLTVAPSWAPVAPPLSPKAWVLSGLIPQSLGGVGAGEGHWGTQ